MKPRILVIDDEAGIRDSLRMILEYEGYECLLAATGAGRPGAWPSARRPTSCSSTSRCRRWTASRCSSACKARSDALPVVMISGHGTVSTAVEATTQGRLRLHREAARQRSRAADGAQRRRPAPAARRERHAAARRRGAARDGGREPGARARARRHRPGRADQRHRARSSARAASARSWSPAPSTATACAPASASCRSTARRSPRS